MNDNLKSWYNSLPEATRYFIKDEVVKTEETLSTLDFMDVLSARTLLSGTFLRNILECKSRIVMFGAGGTASWFLPKLLKIYNDAFFKCPDKVYPLEIIIIDGDVI